jgi:hypothetical protein
MSQENVERTKLFYERLNEGGMTAVLALLDPNVEWWTRADNPDTALRVALSANSERPGGCPSGGCSGRAGGAGADDPITPAYATQCGSVARRCVQCSCSFNPSCGTPIRLPAQPM